MEFVNQWSFELLHVGASLMPPAIAVFTLDPFYVLVLLRTFIVSTNTNKDVSIIFIYLLMKFTSCITIMPSLPVGDGFSSFSMKSERVATRQSLASQGASFVLSLLLLVSAAVELVVERRD
jgi:hypothetical protein